MNNENFDPNQEAAAPQTPEDPAQTPPTPQDSYSYPPLPRTRRIGTLTMGFALIVTGIIALVATFYPAFDIFTVLKLSPIIFVFLGLEILIGYFRHKGEKLKYDFLSGFVCFVLICGGVVLSLIPTFWDYFGPDTWRVRDQVSDLIEDDLYERLQTNGNIRSLYVNIELPYYERINYKEDPAALTDKTNAYISISLAGSFSNEKDFARECRSILDKIPDTAYRIRQINFNDRGNHGETYSLDLHDKFQLNLKTSALAELVEVRTYDEYDEEEYSDEEYEDMEPQSDASIPETTESSSGVSSEAPVAAAAEASPEGMDAPDNSLAA
ncbi:hypothetical protein [Anaerotruncus rubiinfantis]|uniref:hypothetical protein n=1 Tax=Anaerotruncus rubiinfantis TaxID=1720200 RepID=UPI001897B11E|nr:hypothetical protein [Anaerotruncus rubiinfantis]